MTKEYVPSVYFTKKRLALLWRESVVGALLHNVFRVDSRPTLLDPVFLRGCHHVAIIFSLIAGQVRARDCVGLLRLQQDPRDSLHLFYTHHENYPTG